MTPPRLVTLLLLAAFWWQGERFIAANGPTFDEPVHLAAGYSYWKTGDFRLNVEDPPLAKLLWALPQLLLDPIPFAPDPEQWERSEEWLIGHSFVFDSGRSWQSLLTPARRVNLLFGCGVILVVGRWSGRAWANPWAGCVASAVAAFDPNLVAHSGVLSTDASLAFGTVLSAYLLWEYLTAPTTTKLNLLGLAVGLALGAKFSAVAAVLATGAAVVAYLLMGGAIAMPGQRPSGPVSFAARVRLAMPVAARVGVIALVVLAAVYFFVRFPSWGVGLKYQLTRSESNDTSFFLLGEISPKGWWWYFPAALAMKVPVGTLGLFAVVMLFSLARRFRLSKVALTTVVVLPLVLFAAVCASRVNLGVRVALAVLPFVYVFAGRAVTLPGPTWVRASLVVLGVGGVVFAGIRSSPYPLSYFNEFVGGPERGVQLLGDSNLDWGQGLPALKEYQDREEVPVIYLSYYGTAPPRAFGVTYQYLPGHGMLERPTSEVVPTGSRQVVAVSGCNLQGIYLKDPQTYAWLRNLRPSAVLAGSIWVFDITDDAEAVDRIRRMADDAVR